MKYFKGKIILATILTIIATTINISPIYALSTAESRKIKESSNELSKVMEYIQTYYIEDISTEELFEGAMRGISDELDEYSFYYSPKEFKKLVNDLTGSLFGLGIVYTTNIDKQIEIVNVLESTPAKNAGILKGDVIIAVNGYVLDSYTGAAAYVEMTDDSVKTLVLTVDRNGEIIEISVQKEILNLDSVFVKDIGELIPSAKNKDNSNIGYILIDQIREKTNKELQDAIAELKKKNVTHLILDLRDNPGGLMDVADSISQSLVPEGIIFSTVDALGNKSVSKSTLKEPPFEKIVVLTNNYTASAAELIAAALQDSEAATIVGQKTYGKGVIQTFIPLKNNGALRLTTMEYYRRNGEKLNKIGITPNIPVFIPDFVYGTVNVNKNGTSEKLTSIKEILTYIGYETGEANTYYDDKTKKAVTAFQKDNGLTSNGELTFETVQTMNIKLYNYTEANDDILAKGYEVLIND